MLFDVLLQLQSARQQPSTKRSNLIRASIRRLRQALGAGQTTSATEPETSEVSRQLTLSFLRTCDDNEGPF
jgi:inactivated superfamily I helicase